NFVQRAVGGFFNRFNNGFARTSNGYSMTVGRLLGRRSLMMGIYVLLLGMSWVSFQSLPKGFIPVQDKQYLISFAQLPTGATLDRTEAVIRQMSDIANAEPG